jgi:hypothetical protein
MSWASVDICRRAAALWNKVKDFSTTLQLLETEHSKMGKYLLSQWLSCYLGTSFPFTFSAFRDIDTSNISEEDFKKIMQVLIQDAKEEKHISNDTVKKAFKIIPHQRDLLNQIKQHYGEQAIDSADEVAITNFIEDGNASHLKVENVSVSTIELILFS